MKVPNDTQGKTVKCPKCHMMQVVPEDAKEQAPPAKKPKKQKRATSQKKSKSRKQVAKKAAVQEEVAVEQVDVPVDDQLVEVVEKEEACEEVVEQKLGTDDAPREVSEQQNDAVVEEQVEESEEVVEEHVADDVVKMDEGEQVEEEVVEQGGEKVEQGEISAAKETEKKDVVEENKEEKVEKPVKAKKKRRRKKRKAVVAEEKQEDVAPEQEGVVEVADEIEEVVEMKEEEAVVEQKVAEEAADEKVVLKDESVEEVEELNEEKVEAAGKEELVFDETVDEEVMAGAAEEEKEADEAESETRGKVAEINVGAEKSAVVEVVEKVGEQVDDEVATEEKEIAADEPVMVEMKSETSDDAEQLGLFEGDEAEGGALLSDTDLKDKVKEGVEEDDSSKLVLRKSPKPSGPRLAITLDGSGKIDDAGEPESVEGEVVLVKELKLTESDEGDVDVGIDEVEVLQRKEMEEAIASVEAVDLGQKDVSVNEVKESHEESFGKAHEVAKVEHEVEEQRVVLHESGYGGETGVKRVVDGVGRTVKGGEPYFVLWALSLFLRVMGIVLIIGAVRLTDEMTGPDTGFMTSLMWLLIGLTGCAAVYTIGEIAAIFRERMLDESD
ncbi:hypothetical protein JD969_02425 [Planctomycetota bacterium]|nr:hypothetical protein JD969_02425 [Planctomycetota bacterium]